MTTVKPKLSESELQSQCVSWFRMQYPKLILFAIPNGAMLGGKNRFAMMNMLKKTGLTTGVADLFLLDWNDSSHGLFIEMKVGKNKLSEAQEKFRDYCIVHDYAYEVCRSFEEFKETVEEYLEGQVT